MTQTIKLGLPGLEITLQDESRSFANSGNSLNVISATTATGSTTKDFISNKRSFTINYSVVSEADREIISSIYQSQLDTASVLSFIYTDQDGENLTANVKMNAPVYGSTLPKKNKFYYSGTTIELEEY